MFGVSPDLVKLLTTFGGYLTEAIEQVMKNKAAGVANSPEALAAYLESRLAEWNPQIKGRPLSDPETKKAAARLLAGIACNFADPAAAAASATGRKV